MCWGFLAHLFIFMKRMRSLYKTFILVIAIAGTYIQADSKSLKDLWLTIPENIVPYLDDKMRTECVDLYYMHANGETTNRLKGKSKVDTLTTSFMQIVLNNACTMQIKTLPTANTDSIICVVKTYNIPQKESSVNFYDQEWKKLYTMKFDENQFVSKPDTMSRERFEELKSKIDPVFVHATLNANTNDLNVQISTIDFEEDAYKVLSPILLKRKFNWNGKSFK